jgi:ubiquitin-conjugating enzyme E2 G1
MATPGASAAILLSKQFKKMQKEDHIVGISVGLIDNNIFEWEVMLMLSDEIPLYGSMHCANSLVAPKLT